MKKLQEQIDALNAENKPAAFNASKVAEMRKVNFTDKDLFIEYLTSRLGLLNESYKDTPIAVITFDYIIKEGLADGDRALLKSDVYTPSKFSYNNLNIPLSMNPSDFGTILTTEVFIDYHFVQ